MIGLSILICNFAEIFRMSGTSYTKYLFLPVLMLLAIAIAVTVWLVRLQPQEEQHETSSLIGKKDSVQRTLKIKDFDEKRYPTPNYDRTRKNEVKGIVLHHTGELTLQESLEILSSPERKVSSHVVIDTDGTRYVLADPTVVTFHAGLSMLNGCEHCNYFTIGIEFQGNTLMTPLTSEQIASAIEYLLPIIEKYDIPLNNIVTHEMVRNAYREQHPDKPSDIKVDITPSEYAHFMQVLRSYYIIRNRIYEAFKS